MEAKTENKLLAVIRVRGRAGVRHDIKETLTRLNLDRINNLALIFGTKPNMGMIKKCNDYITYGEINEETLTKLAAKKELKANKEELKEILAGTKKPQEIIRMPIRMHPPRRGYEGIKASYGNKGSLGYRGEKVNDLLKRMI
jgi:large subunit ribosomal protein L30